MDEWVGAVQDPGWWLTTGLAVTGGVLGAGGNVANTGAVTIDAAAMRANVLSNIADSQAGSVSSNFGKFVSNEGKVQEAVGVWPPNRGRLGPVETAELPPGALIDRYAS